MKVRLLCRANCDAGEQSGGRNVTRQSRITPTNAQRNMQGSHLAAWQCLQADRASDVESTESPRPELAWLVRRMVEDVSAWVTVALLARNLLLHPLRLAVMVAQVNELLAECCQSAT